MPQPGDLIEIKRRGYQHWAVDVGDGDVVHLVKDDNSSLPIYQSDRWIRGCQVKKEKLEDVAGDNEWQVNNTRDRKQAPLPAEQIEKNALSLVENTVHYRLLQYNCEHFANELRYGHATSMQVMKLMVGVGVIIVVLAVTIVGPSRVAKAAIKGANLVFTKVRAALKAASATLKAVPAALKAASAALKAVPAALKAASAALKAAPAALLAISIKSTTT
ncbi:phospholipase A and acyltransferase 3-like [Solea solea]|uniref:phospholipase A and acyltransferase 3-like n=1 Tax=Solea solea TaxID=90069 RepID=UPI00272C45B4|nr:phospholipase A and acyltransferase 3-like [Solea solea]